MMIAIDKIRDDGGTQTRASLSAEYIDELAEYLNEGEGHELPDIVVYDDGENLWLSDGFHRLGGYRKSGKTEIPADVRKGSLQDALLHSAGANGSHGLRRTNDDKREAVKMLLKVKEWQERSNAWIAEKCRVSDHLVASVRESFTTSRKRGSKESSDKKATSQTSKKTSDRSERRGKDGKSRKRPQKKNTATTRQDVKDKLGNVVPDRLRDVFADTSLADLIGEVETVHLMTTPEAWLNKAIKLTDHYHFLLVEKFKEHAWESLRRLELAAEALKSGLPHAVCPKCNAEQNGKLCRFCRGDGFVPEHRFAEMQRDAI